MKRFLLSIVLFGCFFVLSQSISPIPYQLWKKVLFIGAHPDDIEGCSGGLVSALIAQKTQVFYVIVTNGDKGCGNTFCRNWTTEHIAFVRHQEALDAAAVLGIPNSNVVLLNYEDTMVTSYPEQDIRYEIINQIRRLTPDAVLTWYPYPIFQLQPSQGWDDLGYHPDHQAVGKIVLDSVFVAGVSRSFPNIPFPAWRPEYFYMWEFLQPTSYFALSDVALQKKIDSYLAHKTQYPSPDLVSYFIKLITNKVAENANVSAEYIEGFTSYF